MHVLGFGEQPAESVLFDNQAFSFQRKGGISRYFVHLIQALQNNPMLQVAYSHPYRTANAHALGAGLAKSIPGVDLLNCSPQLQDQVLRAVGYAQLLYLSQRRRRSKGYIIYHPTFYWRRRFVETGGPVVVTVHDMIPELMPELFRRNPHRDKNWYLHRADAIISVSRSTANDVARLYPELAGKLSVVHHGVDLSIFSPVGPSESGIPRPWVLFVGGRNRYKDFDIALSALSLAPVREVNLVVVGPDPTSRELRRIDCLGLARRVFFLSASDERLAVLYRSADAFVFPSRYEGFGLPTLEAMASGTLAIVARTAVHSEVGGDSALYFEAGNSEYLAEQIAVAVYNQTVRETLSSKGLARARQFSWDNAAQKTLDVYRAL